MAVRFKSLDTKVKYVGLFDLKDIYRNTRDLLQDKGYISSSTFKFMETLYLEKIPSEPHRGKELWIWWRTSKTEAGNTYLRIHCDIDFHMRYIQDVEIMEGGQKIKVQKGEVEISLQGYIILDPENKWEKHWFLKQVHPLFYKRIWAKRRETYVNTSRSDIYTFQQYLKDYLGLKQFGAKKFGFYPEAPKQQG